MPDNCGNFRMIGISGDEDEISCFGMLFHNSVDLCHKRTGGIHIGIPSLFQFFIHLCADAVRAYYHAFVRVQLGDGVHDPCATPGEVVHHVLVVDDGTQGGDVVMLLQCLVAELDGTVYAKAKAGGLSNGNFSHDQLFLRCPGRLFCLFFLFQCGTFLILCDLEGSAVFRHIVQDRERRIFFHHGFDAVHDVLTHGVHLVGRGLGVQPVVCGIDGLSHPNADAAAEV